MMLPTSLQQTNLSRLASSSFQWVYLICNRLMPAGHAVVAADWLGINLEPVYPSGLRLSSRFLQTG